MKREVHSGSEIAESCSNSVIFYSRAFLRLMGGGDDLVDRSGEPLYYHKNGRLTIQNPTWLIVLSPYSIRPP
jgi:hypothetical protein